jgi:hypothetical protein
VDLLTTLATCSLHADITLVLAMAFSFSAGNPYVVRDASSAVPVQGAAPDVSVESPPTPFVPVDPKTEAEGIAALHRVEEQRGVPLIGLLPTPPTWAAMFGRKPGELLNACINVSIATARLSEFEYECGHADRTCVLRRYAAAVGMPSFEAQVAREIKARKMPNASRAVIDTDTWLDAPIVAASAGDVTRDWGSDRIFFPGVTPPAAADKQPAPQTAKSKRRQ